MKYIASKSAAILLAATLSLTGCQATQDSAQPTITKAEISRYARTGAVQGYYLGGDLSMIFTWGRDAGAQRMLGTVVDILHPVTIHVSEREESVWVPVVIRVEQADPALPNETYKVRLFANSETKPDLHRIYIGQRVIAVGGQLETDKAGVEAIGLGWLLEVADDGTITDLNPKNKVEGKFNDFTGLLRMEPLG